MKFFIIVTLLVVWSLCQPNLPTIQSKDVRRERGVYIACLQQSLNSS